MYQDRAKLGAKAESGWNDMFLEYGKAYPELHLELQRRIRGDLPNCWEDQVAMLSSQFQESD